ncbi:LysR family transcriptional regulator [Parasphingorhabdus sp.]|uniref:LysR family transcriptional regulator n=1 Tax=Parasphingorhabdus sp. TaxID=2709688 RepID=UPI0032EB8910
MSGPDLNLLTTLDALLQQGSVAGAGRKLGLSPSAMSRALARLRTVTGDPLLVRAGRGLVPTPRADAMRDEVRRIVEDARAVLRPAVAVDLYRLDRTFVLRTSDGFAETIGPTLVQCVTEEAPHVRIRFIRKLDKDSTGLRDGDIDLETGVVGSAIGPEVRARSLFTDRYVGVVRTGHHLSSGPMNAARYADGRHVQVARQGLDLGGIDERLKTLGFARNIVTTVDGFAAALALARGSDLVSTVPELHTLGLRDGMVTFVLPVDTDEFTVSLLWHPRLDGDAAHRWLRNLVLQTCDKILRTDLSPF